MSAVDRERTEFSGDIDPGQALPPTNGSGVRARAGSLLPGGVVGDGRYRLLAQFGVDARGGAQLWRARDGQLRRDVALTVLVGNAADSEAAKQARRTLERAAHAARFTHPGTAKVIDVLSLGNGISASEGVLGIVVADWTQGTDLVDLIGHRALAPDMASKLLQPLASAVEQAHHSGIVLGVDHPQRLRVTPDGKLRLAFPGPLPDSTLRADVKGLGAVLYLLLTGRWPLPGGPQALPPAPTGPNGSIAAPKTLEPAVPADLSAVAVRSLEDDSVNGIRTGAAILRVLEQAAANADRDELRQRIAASGESAEPEPGTQDENGVVWTTRKPVKDRARRRKLAVGVTILTVLTVGVLAWLGMQVISFFSDGGSSSSAPPPSAASTAQNEQNENTQQPKPAQGPAKPVKPESVAVFNVSGSPDGVSAVDRTIDGDPGTTWSTDAYYQPFPALKPGIGVVANFSSEVNLAQVNVDSPSEGTEVEIRAADSPEAPLESTQVVGTATLSGGLTEIKLDKPTKSRHFIVWITKLAGTDPENQSELGELKYLPAG
ncbi:hypothetical protein EV191_1011380 [Tamaricihabitans halophyticus]|uniref:non-specific serine/threonine protein kinase n=1 Tax=Tamaricihabitans halophyticus TaxID=1262583 RepID=A0A4R2RDE3_9PSEU|nr:protein kinase family protein [Tamaricihabitans halophyticus]TCP57425.1 hypothetical protein EV191_1011380 [Tamaricihabitans halophyticus]